MELRMTLVDVNGPIRPSKKQKTSGLAKSLIRMTTVDNEFTSFCLKLTGQTVEQKKFVFWPIIHCSWLYVNIVAKNFIIYENVYEKTTDQLNASLKRREEN